MRLLWLCIQLLVCLSRSAMLIQIASNLKHLTAERGALGALYLVPVPSYPVPVPAPRTCTCSVYLYLFCVPVPVPVPTCTFLGLYPISEEYKPEFSLIFLANWVQPKNSTGTEHRYRVQVQGTSTRCRVQEQGTGTGYRYRYMVPSEV